MNQPRLAASFALLQDGVALMRHLAREVTRFGGDELVLSVAGKRRPATTEGFFHYELKILQATGLHELTRCCCHRVRYLAEVTGWLPKPFIFRIAHV